MSDTNVNPETNRDVKPFEPGDRIALIGDVEEGECATVTRVTLEHYGWLVEIVYSDGTMDVLSWYECECCNLWGEKISN